MMVAVADSKAAVQSSVEVSEEEVRQFTAECFVDDAVACMERIPAVGRLLREGVITSAWFRRTVEQAALINDPEVLAVVDAEVAHRLIRLGGLSAVIVESAVAEVIAEYGPDMLVLAREEESGSE